MVFVVRTMSWSLIARAGLWTYIAFFLAQVRFSLHIDPLLGLLTLSYHQGVTLSKLNQPRTAFSWIIPGSVLGTVARVVATGGLYERPILPIISHMATESCGLCRLPPLRLLSLASTGMTTPTSHTTTRSTTASSAAMHTRPPLEATPSSSAARSLRTALRTCTSTPLLAARKCSRLPTGSSYNPTTACLWPSTGYVL